MEHLFLLLFAVPSNNLSSFAIKQPGIGKKEAGHQLITLVRGRGISAAMFHSNQQLTLCFFLFPNAQISNSKENLWHFHKGVLKKAQPKTSLTKVVCQMEKTQVKTQEQDTTEYSNTAATRLHFKAQLISYHPFPQQLKSKPFAQSPPQHFAPSAQDFPMTGLPVEADSATSCSHPHWPCPH